MPDLNIDTTAAPYQNKITRFGVLRDYLRPQLRRYYKLDEEKKLLWRQNDKLLRMVVNFIDKFNQEKDDNGEGDA